MIAAQGKVQVMHPDLFCAVCPYPWGNSVISYGAVGIWWIRDRKTAHGSWYSYYAYAICPLLREHLAVLQCADKVVLDEQYSSKYANMFSLTISLRDLTHADIDALNAVFTAVSLFAETLR
jgi:hypothetical protein